LRGIKMECSYRSGSDCRIAAESAGLPTVDTVTDRACAVCQRSDPPMARNKVTLDLAITSLLRVDLRQTAMKLLADNHDIYGSPRSANRISRLEEIEAGTGVGSQLWRMLEEIGVEHSATCECLAWAEMLNGWGVAGCRMARDEIAIHLKQEAKKLGWKKLIWKSVEAAARNPGILRWIDLADVYGSIVDEAVRRAEQDELKKAADEFAGRDED
jgi:hypothetical protein